jgi:hypothetical protein
MTGHPPLFLEVLTRNFYISRTTALHKERRRGKGRGKKGREKEKKKKM